MKLKRTPRQVSDERDVDRFLGDVAARDDRAVSTFPRPLVTLLERCPGVRLTVEAAWGLDTRFIVRTLRDRHGLSDASLTTTADDEPSLLLAAYTYAEEDRVVVFYDTQSPVPAQRIALARQTGHIVHELLPELERPRQLPLFHRPRFPFTLSVREPHGAEGALGDERVEGFARELLMPYREIKRLLAEEPGRSADEYVMLVGERFCVTSALARSRLGELWEEGDPRQSVLPWGPPR